MDYNLVDDIEEDLTIFISDTWGIGVDPRHVIKLAEKIAFEVNATMLGSEDEDEDLDEDKLEF